MTRPSSHYYQLHVTFETKEHELIIINSCLEQFAKTLKEESQTYGLFSESEKTLR
jgi:hydroxymethylglutaryl-CoA reductase